MPGLSINGVKYIRLCNDNNLKKKSLYDNVYFTLRDIFVNSKSYNDIIEANNYNDELTGGVCFEDSTENFRYKNVLYQKYYVERLRRWLKTFKTIDWFEFTEPEGDDFIFTNEIDTKKYISFYDWWFQFQELRNLIDIQYEKLVYNNGMI